MTRLLCFVLLLTFFQWSAVQAVAPSSLTYSACCTYTYTHLSAIQTLLPGFVGGTPTSYSGTLPSGLTLDTSTGYITGTPSTIATSAVFTITATNADGFSTVDLTMTVNAIAPSGLSYSTPSGVYEISTAITSNTASTSGGDPVITFSINKALPTGLSLDTNTGVISGTPSAITNTANTDIPTVVSYIITATNTGGSTTVGITITVNDIAPVIDSYTLSDVVLTVYTAASVNSITTSGGAVKVYSVSPSLPTNMLLSNGNIYVLSGGVPVVVAKSQYIVSASNTGGTSTYALNITVNDFLVDGLAYTTPVVYTLDLPIQDNNPGWTTNGGEPISFSAALPTGLSIDTSTGVISGTPTGATSSSIITVTCSNSGGDVTFDIDMTIDPAAPTALVYSSPTSIYTKGQAITSNTPSNSGGTVSSYSVSPSLPSGLSLNTGTGIITGTPTQLLTSTVYTITGINGGGSASTTVTISILDVIPSVVYTNDPVSYSKDILISTNILINTGGTIISSSITPSLPNGLSISTSGAISGVPTEIKALRTYTVTVTNTGGSDTATVDITVNDQAPINLAYYQGSSTFVQYPRGQEIAVNVPTNDGGTIVSYSIDSSLSIDTGLYFSTTNGTITGIPDILSSWKLYTITGTNTGGTVNVVLNISTIDVVPAISYENSGAQYTKDSPIIDNIVLSTGGAMVDLYSVSPTLPTGLSLNTATGTISGTPTTLSGQSSYTITATNTYTSDVIISITVNDVPPCCLNYTTKDSIYTKSTAITNNIVLTVGGGTVVAYTVSPTLPVGLTLNSTSGTISGTPSNIRTIETYIITATNTGGSTTSAITITINDVPPSALTYSGISSPTGAVYTRNSLPTWSPLIPGNEGGIVTSFSISPTLPTGLQLSFLALGYISGTPTVISARQLYTVTATNSGGSTTYIFNLTVNDIPPNNLAYTDPVITYTKSIAITDNTPVYSSLTGGPIVTYTVSSLPTGLSIDSSTGIISGTPTVLVSETIYTVTATNSGGSTSIDITLTVVDAAPTSLTYASSTMVFYRNVPITSQIPSNTGGTIVTYSTLVNLLPVGLSIDASTGIITGTPLNIRSAFDVEVTGTNTGGSTTVILSVEVLMEPPANLVYTPNPVIFYVNTAISRMNETHTGGPILTFTISPSLPSGITLHPTLGYISGLPSAVSSLTIYTITGTNTGGSTTVDITITVNDEPPINLLYTTPVIYYIGDTASNIPSNDGGAIVTYAISPALCCGLTFDTSTGIIGGIPTVIGSSSLYTITGTNTGGQVNAIVDITVTDPPPIISYTSISANYTIDVVMSNTLTNTGGVLTTLSISPTLPTGMTFSTVTGLISGTPTVLSIETSYTVTATNSGGTDTIVLLLSVVDAPPINLFYATPNALYTKSITIATNIPSVTGGTVVLYTITPSLPNGLVLNPTTGHISGTPTIISASTTYLVTAKNTGGKATTNLIIEVLDLAPVISLTSCCSLVYVLYTTITPNQGTLTSGGAVTAWTITPSLPTGLSLNTNTGLITGTPTILTNTTTYTLRADNSGGFDEISFDITVQDVPPSNLVYSDPAPVYVINNVITNNVPNNTGGTIVTYSISPSLPTGLVINRNTGIISGTSTVVASPGSIYIITGTNSGGSTTVSILLEVIDAPPVSLIYANGNSQYIITVGISDNIPSSSGGTIVTYTISPTLPTGLSIDISTGYISGTSTVVSPTTSYTVTGTNSGGTAQTVIFIQVIDFPPTNLQYSVPIASYITNNIISPDNTPSNSGGTITNYVSSPSLPNGLVLDSVTGIISGTPIVAISSRTYTITGSNTGGSTTVDIIIEVIAEAPNNLYYDINPVQYAINILITNNNPHNSGGLIDTYSINPTLPTGLIFNTTTGIISGTATIASSATNYTVVGTNTGGTTSVILNLEVLDDPPTALSYLDSSPVYTSGFVITPDNTPSNSGGVIINYVSSPALPRGIILDSITGIISGTPVEMAAATIYTITGSNSGGSTSTTINLEVTEVIPSNMIYKNVTAIYTITYPIEDNYVISNDGSPPSSWSFTTSPLPTGLSFNTSTGYITGTPTVLWSSVTYTVQGCNSAGCATTTVTLSVVNEQLPIVIYTPGDSSYSINTLITDNIPTISGGNVVTWSISPTLPTGLIFDSNTGIISGTPTVVSVSTPYIVSASNTGGTTQVVLILSSNDDPPLSLVYSSPIIDYTLNILITNNIPTSTGGTITTYSISPSLPTGLSIDTSTGIISGTPTVITAATTYTVLGSNTGGFVGSVLTIGIVDVAPATITYNGLIFRYPINTVITTMTPVTTGGTIVSYTVSPTLPTGLSIDGFLGTIDGTPTIVTSSTIYTVTAINSGGAVSIDLNLTITDQPPINLTYTDMTPSYGINAVITNNIPILGGGGTVITYSVSPTLPMGLMLDGTTGIVSGTPTVLTAAVIYTFRARNSGGSAYALVNLAVIDGPPTLLSYTSLNAIYIVGNIISTNIASNSGGAVVLWSVTPSLPTGLSLNTATGDISGTPTIVTSIATYTITGTNSGGSATVDITITVNDAAPLSLSYTKQAPVYSYSVPINDNIPSNTGGVITNYLMSPNITQLCGLKFNKFTGYLYGTPTSLMTNTTFQVTGENSGGFVSIFLYVTIIDLPPTALSYSCPLCVYEVTSSIIDNTPSSQGGPVVSYSISPSLSTTGLSIDINTGIISGTPIVVLPTTIYTITATNTGGSVITAVVLTINDLMPINLLYSDMNITYNRNIMINNNIPSNTGGFIVSYSITPALPSGLIFDLVSGIISGTPVVYSDPTIYTVVGVNTGGSVYVKIIIGVRHNDIVFSLPEGIDSIGISAFQSYFDNINGISVVVTNNNNELNDLLNHNSDVINVDALTAYEGYKKFDFQILAVEISDYRSSKRYLSTPMILTSNKQITNFASLQGKSVCFGGSTRSDSLYMPIVYAINQGFITGTSSTAALDDCDSPLIYLADNYFGSSCAPPVISDHVGMCNLCPRTMNTGCNITNIYATPIGALRGLSEGVCDVAFVRDTTYSDACESDGPESWCLGFNDYKGLTDIDNFGIVPSDVFMIRSSQAMSNNSMLLLRNALEGISLYPELLFYLDAKGISKLPDQGYPIASSFDTNFHLSSMDNYINSIPGFNKTMDCVHWNGDNSMCSTLSYNNNCNNFGATMGASASEPIKFGLPAGLSSAGKAEFDRYFASILQLTGVYVIGVDYNNIESLRIADVDVVHLDSAEALVGWKMYGFEAIAVEVTKPTIYHNDTEYITTAWVHQGSELRTFASLKGQRSCHAGYLSAAGTFNPLIYLSEPNKNITTGFNINENGHPLHSCDSPITASTKNFFLASCIPPVTLETEGICDLCSSMEPCNKQNRYSGSNGALRGLNERACEVSFIREDTWDLYCTQPETVTYYSDLVPPSWCLDKSLFRKLDDLTSMSFGAAPSDTFMVRGGVMSNDVLTAVYNIILGLQNEVALLRLLHYNNIRGLQGYGTSVATKHHLGQYQSMISNKLTGWTELTQCAIDPSGVTCPRASVTNCTASNSYDASYWNLVYSLNYNSSFETKPIIITFIMILCTFIVLYLQ